MGILPIEASGWKNVVSDVIEWSIDSEKKEVWLVDQELISVIVPVYNVEKFLRRCLDSLIHQTYKELQIIIINDGTKDSSLEIACEYQKKDNRVEVYTKNNGGLSSARNYGITYIKGRYVCFVDSDDWVAIDYVETLYRKLKESDADISCAGFLYAYEEKKEDYQYAMKSLKMNKDEALKALCEGKWLTNHVWNKLYKADLFTEIRFEEGRCFEDIYIMHQLFSKAQTVVCINSTVYYYYMREDSIIHETNPQNDADIFIGYYKRYTDLNSDELKKITLKYCAWSCFKVIYLLDKKKIKSDDLRIATEFWNRHQEIVSLGIKYLIMYKFPTLYKLIFVY